MIRFIADPLFKNAFLKNDKFRTGIKDYTTESLTCIVNGRAGNNEACSIGVEPIASIPSLILGSIKGITLMTHLSPAAAWATSAHPRA